MSCLNKDPLLTDIYSILALNFCFLNNEHFDCKQFILKLFENKLYKYILWITPATLKNKISKIPYQVHVELFIVLNNHL